jgi:hypothetical protein
MSIVYELILLGVVPDEIEMPKWIFEKEDYMINFLLGVINGLARFNFSTQRYKDKDYGYFSISFERSSKPLISYLKDLCENLSIETSGIYSRVSKKPDPRTGKFYKRHSIVVQKKDSCFKMLLDLIRPKIWEIESKKVKKYFEMHNISWDSVLFYDPKYLVRKEFNYSRDLALPLLNRFEIYGNFDDVTNSFNSELLDYNFNVLGKDRIIKHIKSLFQEDDFYLAYGDDGYNRWYQNNSRFFIGCDLESIIIPYHILVQIYRKLYQILDEHGFILDNSTLIKKLISYLTTTLMRKNNNVVNPNLKQFGRLTLLLEKSDKEEFLIQYFVLIAEFIKKIKWATNLDIETSYTQLREEFKILFYHHQQVKSIVEDLKNAFDVDLKVGITSREKVYKWHQLLFRWNRANFSKISNFNLKTRLGVLFDKIESGDYDYDMFEIRNPSCSDFQIHASRGSPLRETYLEPHVEFLIENKTVLTGDESYLGKTLIGYINLAEDYYRKNFSEKNHEIFSNENNISHDILQVFIMKNNENIISTVVLVWLRINDPSLEENYISGHIDFLIYYNGILYICDYKPDKRDKNFLRSLPQVSYYALLLGEFLNFPDLKIKCITFNKYQAWEYDPFRLFTYVSRIISKLKQTFPSISAPWEKYFKYLNQFHIHRDKYDA